MFPHAQITRYWKKKVLHKSPVTQKGCMVMGLCAHLSQDLPSSVICYRCAIIFPETEFVKIFLVFLQDGRFICRETGLLLLLTSSLHPQRPKCNNTSSLHPQRPNCNNSRGALTTAGNQHVDGSFSQPRQGVDPCVETSRAVWVFCPPPMPFTRKPETECHGKKIPARRSSKQLHPQCQLPRLRFLSVCLDESSH